MATGSMTYGDITPRTAAYVVKDLLKRGLPFLTIERFGATYVLPLKSTKSAKFRRYHALALATIPLVEGVTPTGKKLTYTDITVELEQYGDFIPLTDVVLDTHEDPILQESSTVLGEQAAQTMEVIRYGVLKAGTNVMYANGSARTDVNTPITIDLQRRATRALKRQNATMINEVLQSSPSFNKESVEAGYIALCHTDLDTDIRKMDGFISTKNYASGTKPFANEIGAVEDVRYLRSTLFAQYPDAGGTAGAMLSTTGSLADVYPVLIFGRNAYGLVPLKGKNGISVMVVNPGPAAGDPLGQKGTIGWKNMHACVILNDAWMIRLEVAATN